MSEADDLIRLLGMRPHPEGGHYRENFRDNQAGGRGRAHSTGIYFLLRPGELRVLKGGRETFLAVGEGFVEIKGDSVSVLTDLALGASSASARRF